MTYQTNMIPIPALPEYNAPDFFSHKLTHRNPRHRTWAMDARSTMFHEFDYVVFNDDEHQELLLWLEGRCDIWLVPGCGTDGYWGSIPVVCGGHRWFRVETPSIKTAMLFRLTFGGAA